MPLKSLGRRSFPHQTGAPVVDFEHVTVRYQDRPALDDVSFQVWPAERIAIIGPNGAGKTTLLKLISGILPPTNGRADIYGYGASGHICIGYVPQRSQVDWRFPVTARDVVMMGRIARIGLFRQPSGHDREVVQESLNQVGLVELANRQLGQLSGGQQQRIFIARALAQEAELLLMDEPLTGLDVPSQEAIFGIFDGLRERGITLLVSMHDLNLAAKHFDRLMLLNHRLYGLGRPDEVLIPANLRLAYGTHMTVIEGPEGILALSDTCCDGSVIDG